MHLSAVCMCVCGGREEVWGCLNAVVAHVYMTCMSDDCSRQHGKYKIGHLCKKHCADQAFREVCVEKRNCRNSFNYKLWFSAYEVWKYFAPIHSLRMRTHYKF